MNVRVILIVALIVAPYAAGAAVPVSYKRSDVVETIASLGKISTPEGIQSLEQVNIGGVPQWISIRGMNRKNPVILFVHGGPGSPAMPMSWAFQKPWEDFFTVVQWDQRGTGKNWAHTHPERLAPTVTLERLVLDAEEVVSWLRKKLHKDKVVILGWSYGTTIGVRLVERRPEWISAYVGVGQTTESQASETYIYRQLLRIAKQRQQSQALKELEDIQPYPNLALKNDGDHIDVVRRWVRTFNGSWYGQSDLTAFWRIENFAPEYTSEDARTLDAANGWFINALTDNPSSGGSYEPDSPPTTLQVPVFLLMGRYDLQTPYVKAKEYFEKLQAPRKRFITFERSAHFVIFEQPGMFLKTLLDEVMPLTEGAQPFEELADAPP